MPKQDQYPTATIASGDKFLGIDVSDTVTDGDADGSTKLFAISELLQLIPQTLAFAAGDETTAIAVATGLTTIRAPYAMTATEVRASLTTAQTSGTVLTVDVKINGVSMFSTLLTFDNTEKTTTTATTPAVISTAAIADDDEVTVDVTQIGDGTAAGLKVYIVGTTP